MHSFFPDDASTESNDCYAAENSADDACVLSTYSDGYPPALHDLANPPATLWAKGILLSATLPAVAIVGTRNASPYGLRIAKAISATCARAGVAVVSGLARGIDGAAHQAALDAGGRTVAVLGTGLNVVYPRSHRVLQERIGRDGLLLTEHPPDSTGHAGAFPQRNRIIAALATMIVVVEAGKDSGALITSTRGRELGRHIAMVPGPIDSPSAIGSNNLLNEGASPILSPDDVLQLLSIDPSPPVLPFMDKDAARCWDSLAKGATELSDIARVAGLSSRAAAAAISALELEGLVVVDIAGRVRSTLA